MESIRHSVKFKSLYVARFALEMAGVLLLVFSLFGALIYNTLRNGAHNLHSFQRGLAITIFMFFDSVGLLWPKVRIKVLASLLLASAGIWTFFHDAYRWDNLRVYSLFLLPLLLALWLWTGYRNSKLKGFQVAIGFPKKPGIVAYLTAGDPDLVTTRDIALAAIDNGADVIELGVPFSDPLADGPVIQRASERAVGRGVRLTDVLDVAKEIRAARPNAGLVLFSYLNPVVRRGMKRLCQEAAEAGINGILLTDMIVEEAGESLEAMRENQLAPIFLAAPTSPDRRLKAIAEASLATGKTGFVYAISRVGITGTQTQVAGDAAELVARLRRFTALPIAVGFGISNAEHVAAVGRFADAAVIGSALVALIEKSTKENAPAAIGRFILELQGKTAQSSEGQVLGLAHSSR